MTNRSDMKEITHPKRSLAFDSIVGGKFFYYFDGRRIQKKKKNEWSNMGPSLIIGTYGSNKIFDVLSEWYLHSALYKEILYTRERVSILARTPTQNTTQRLWAVCCIGSSIWNLWEVIGVFIDQYSKRWGERERKGRNQSLSLFPTWICSLGPIRAIIIISLLDLFQSLSLLFLSVHIDPIASLWNSERATVREREKDLRPYNDNELKMLPLVKSVDDRMPKKKMQTALFR